jgi:geranylgeranyl diphosphate synthase, type I
MVNPASSTSRAVTLDHRPAAAIHAPTAASARDDGVGVLWAAAAAAATAPDAAARKVVRDERSFAVPSVTIGSACPDLRARVRRQHTKSTATRAESSAENPLTRIAISMPGRISAGTDTTPAILGAVKILPASGVDDEAVSFRSSVDLELARFLEATRERVAGYAPESVAIVLEVRRLVEAGGKRIRPLFCYWGHRAAGGREGAPMARAGAAIEMLHTAAIIHDDLIDRAEVRRGAPSTVSRFRAEGASEQFGGAAAILAGDLAQALADELLATSPFPPELVIQAEVHFSRMRVEAISGEFLDLLTAGGKFISYEAGAAEARARRVAALKSGAYTVVGPLLVGASLAGAAPEVFAALRAYGEPLGEAFQLRDDVLGTFGDPATTGKDRDSDIRLGVGSTMMAKALRLAHPDARALIVARLGKARQTEAEIEDVREAIRSSGALAETLDLIDSLAGRARAALSAAPIRPPASAALSALAEHLALRDS